MILVTITTFKGKFNLCKIRKAATIRDQYNPIPHLSQDTTWESDKITTRHHKQEPKGQPFPSR